MSDRHPAMASIDVYRPDGINGPDTSFDEKRPQLSVRHIELAHQLLGRGHGVGVMPAGYWVAFVSSNQSGLMVTIDLDLLLLANDLDVFLLDECAAYEESLRNRIDAGWRPE